MNRSVLHGSLLCLIASMSWGAMFPVAHAALQHIDAFYFSFIRYAIVAILLSIVLYAKEGKAAFRLEGKGLAVTFYGSMAFVVYNMCVFLGQQQMGEKGIIIASIMEVLMPIITIMFVWIVSRKTPGKKTALNIIIAFIGAVLVITRGDFSFFFMNRSELLPLLLVFIGVTAWVIYSLGASKFNGWSILRYSTLTCILGSFVSFIVVSGATAAGLIDIPTLHTLNEIKWDMAFMSLLPGLVALLSWNKGLQLLSSTNGILFINFVPITTFIIVAFQGYTINAYEILGTLIIIAALVHNTLMQGNQMASTSYTLRKYIRFSKVKLVRTTRLWLSKL